jgi:hypothetical protein
MSALRMIAWGMVDFEKLTPKEYQKLRQQVRDELRHGTPLRLVANGGSNRFALHVRPPGEPMSKRIKRYKGKPHYRGDLQACCRVAFGLLYPRSNEDA